MKKSKLLLSIISLCFALAVLTFGVFAANQVNYTISGNISYTVSDVFVEVKSGVYYSTQQCVEVDGEGAVLADCIADEGVSAGTYWYSTGGNGTWYGTTEEDASYNEDYGRSKTFVALNSPITKIKTYDSSTGSLLNPPSPNVTSETSQNLTFGTGANQGYSYFIVFEIKNYGNEPVNVTVTPTAIADTNIHTNITSTTSFTITSKGQRDYALGKFCYCLCLKDVTANASATYSLTIQVARPSVVTTNNGYTLYRYADGFYRMKYGTYNNRDIYWRLMTNGGTNVTGALSDGVSGNANFLQDTFTNEKQFHESSNVYSTGSIRSYLTSTSSGGFVSDLNISTGDGTLYNSITTVDGDKFWLMSKDEAESWFANDDARIYKLETVDDYKAYIDDMGDPRGDYAPLAKYGVWYWLRSPNAGTSGSAYNVYGNGGITYGNVYNTFAVRAAFQLAL